MFTSHVCRSGLAVLGAAGLMGAMAAPVSAALLGSYTFENHSLAPTDAIPNDGITFSDFSVGTYGDLTDNNAPSGALRLAGNDTAAGKDNTAGAMSSGEYFSFSITIDSGASLDLSSIEIDYTATNIFNLVTARVFSSVHGFDHLANDTITQLSISTTATLSTLTIDLDNPASNPGVGANVNDGASFDLTGPTSITFYFPFLDESNVDTRYVDFHEIRINGVVVPEPAVASLLGVGALLLRRRRR